MMIEVPKAVFSRRSPAAALIGESLRSPILPALLTINLLLIIGHLIVAGSPNEVSGSWTDLLRIDRDRSLGEWFESAELAVAILLLIKHARLHYRPSNLLVAVLFAFMLCDNILELREFVAVRLAPGQQAIAELTLVAAAAPMLVGAAVRAYRQAGPDERSGLATMFIVLAFFGFFAVAFDFLHELALAYGPKIYAALSVVEEGGELITLSVLLVVVIHLTRDVPVRLPDRALAQGRHP